MRVDIAQRFDLAHALLKRASPSFRKSIKNSLFEVSEQFVALTANFPHRCSAATNLTVTPNRS
jgi:hypothetical protein